MSDSSPDKNQGARSAIQRVAEVARQGQARLNAYRQETAALGTWLRSHLFRQGSKGQQVEVRRSLQNTLTPRRLRERQRVHRNNGGGHSSTAIHALRRAAQAVRRKRR